MSKSRIRNNIRKLRFHHDEMTQKELAEKSKLDLENKKVLQFYETHGKNKCVEFLMEKNSSCLEQPSKQAYAYSVNKLVTNNKLLKKSVNRPSGASKYECFLHDTYSFPICDISKRGPNVSTSESLDLEMSLKTEKKKNIQLSEEVVTLKNQNANIEKKT